VVISRPFSTNIFLEQVMILYGQKEHHIVLREILAKVPVKVARRRKITNRIDEKILVEAAGVKPKCPHGWRGFTAKRATWGPQRATSRV
jgi:hypothetical protein